MGKRITGAELKKALGEGLDELFEEVARAINKAQAGRIIADSEEPVRDAAAEFRQRLYQKALDIRQQDEEGAFSPSASGGGNASSRQGSANDLACDGERQAGDHPQGVLDEGKAKHRAGRRVAGDKH